MHVLPIAWRTATTAGLQDLTLFSRGSYIVHIRCAVNSQKEEDAQFKI
jgi:hypothetical protein